MARRLPQNLARLAEQFGPDAASGILPPGSLHVDGVEFVSDYRADSSADRFFIIKPPDVVERFAEYVQRFPGSNIFELGIAEGGSTALVALVAQPRRLVAVELEPEPLDALAAFIQARGLDEIVRPYYGVDQADTARLTEIVDLEFGDEPLDLVIDDASHQIVETRASFEALFPRVRPGGTYVIEDWSNDHVFWDGMVRAMRESTDEQKAEFVRLMAEQASADAGPPTRHTPLSQLAVQLLLARASSGDVVERVTVGNEWLIVTRGPAPLEAGVFRVADCYEDHFGFLAAQPVADPDAEAAP
jgi:predicted O-methyltransferase YrrM